MRPRPTQRLRRRLVITFTAFALFTAMVFGTYSLVFMYVVEDSIFNAQLDREARAQLARHAHEGDWGRLPTPPSSCMTHLRPSLTIYAASSQRNPGARSSQASMGGTTISSGSILRPAPRLRGSCRKSARNWWSDRSATGLSCCWPARHCWS